MPITRTVTTIPPMRSQFIVGVGGGITGAAVAVGVGVEVGTVVEACVGVGVGFAVAVGVGVGIGVGAGAGDGTGFTVNEPVVPLTSTAYVPVASFDAVKIVP